MLLKDFVSQIFKKIKASGSSQIDTGYLKDNSWFHITKDVLKSKTVFIFKQGGQLLISKDGDITKASWENLVHSTNSLIIEIEGRSTLYNIIYLTTEYLVIQKDGTKLVEVFIKQHRYDTQLPSDKDSNPIELIYDDLKELLNRRNKPDTKLPSPEEKEEDLFIDKPVKALNEPIAYNKLTRILNKELEKAKNSNEPGASISVFDKHKILHRIKKNYSVSNAQEIDYFIYAEEIEEELKDKGIWCSTCCSMHTIHNGICSVCQEYNFCHLCSLAYYECQCYGKQGVKPDDKRLMKKYSITYKDEMYHFQKYKYERFKDAINYAMLCEKKAAEASKSKDAPK